MPRLKLILAYEGTHYAGWQLQANEGKGQAPSIQGVVERAVTSLTGARYPLFAAGRTDAGVHAEGQVCHLDLPEDALRLDWQRALNANMPSDIRIVHAQWVDQTFHARKSAISKRYSYTLWMHKDRALPRLRAFCWSVPSLDLSRLAAALPLLEGEHDFASFQNKGTPVRKTVRHLFSVSLQTGLAGPLRCPQDWPVVDLSFEGDGFLKQMVRNLVGLLVWVGLGKIEVERIPSILAACDRRALPSPSAPAKGLSLMQVSYPLPE
ncbi:tRNA pseudouridine(38-40) synthase TruA [Desulfovibrio sp. OttesenSCG-928-M14]|nr:tRNA pseudouridine(38-40) synthase TruA [Desulfovibrio sp. OttesenSCG-928-M14]